MCPPFLDPNDLFQACRTGRTFWRKKKKSHSCQRELVFSLFRRYFFPFFSLRGISSLSISSIKGGRLICCERCPASFHTHCLNMDREPEGSYICYECIIGKTILYGDLVWVKIGVYRWWPARVFPPDEIPVQFHDRFAEASPGEFLVQFYGSHDFAFVHRGQAFLYQEGVSLNLIHLMRHSIAISLNLRIEVQRTRASEL